MTFATSGTNETGPLGNRTGESSLRMDSRATRAGRGGLRERKPYRDYVERLIREGGRTARQVAAVVGGECTPGYVSAVSYCIGNKLFSPEPAKNRGPDDIRADLARQLEDIERRYHESLHAARLKDPI
jgi:hypothetical protein